MEPHPWQPEDLGPLSHFHQAYNELEATNALNIGDLGYGAPNVMKEVVDRISEELLLRANHTSDSVPAQADLIQDVRMLGDTNSCVPYKCKYQFRITTWHGWLFGCSIPQYVNIILFMVTFVGSYPRN